MSHRTIWIAILALGGGVAGGFMQSAAVRILSAQSAAPQVLRIRGLEIVDNSGKRVAFLGTSRTQDAALTFFDTHGTERAEFGLTNWESPHLDLKGPEGSSRLTLDLGQQAKPRMMMSDVDFDARVYLGVVEPDAPDPDWKYNNWVLRFTGDQTKWLAIMGMTTDGAGAIGVSDKSGRRWTAPFK